MGIIRRLPFPNKILNLQMEVRDIQQILYNTFAQHIIVVNSFIFDGRFETDFAYVTDSGFGYEIEIKRSVGDFRNDFNKATHWKRYKHKYIQAGRGRQNYFSFCFESKELAEACLSEVPKQYGVYFVSKGQVYSWALRNPTRLHSRKMDWYKITKKIAASYKTRFFREDYWY